MAYTLQITDEYVEVIEEKEVVLLFERSLFEGVALRDIGKVVEVLFTDLEAAMNPREYVRRWIANGANEGQDK